MSTFNDPIGHLQEPLIFKDGEPFDFFFDFSGNSPVINNTDWVMEMQILDCGAEVAVFDDTKFLKVDETGAASTEKIAIHLVDADVSTLKHQEFIFKLKITTLTDPQRTWIDGKFKHTR